MSEHATELTRLRGMTLIAEDAQIRPAAMSYVKPSEYRYYAERAMQHMVDETTTHATALATVQAEHRIALQQRDQVTKELEEARAKLQLAEQCARYESDVAGNAIADMKAANAQLATARTDTLREVEAWLTLRHPLVAADFHDAFTPTPHQPGARSAPRGR